MGLTRRHFLAGAPIAGISFGASALFDANRVHAQAPRKGGTLRVAMNGSSADTIDAADYVTSGDLLRVLQLYDSLAEMDEHFNLQMALAEEMIAESPDTWTIRLKSGLTFHDGRKVTADDVIYSIRRIIDPKHPKQGSQGIAMIDFNGMTRLDERTVRLKLNSPNAYLIEEFTQIWNPIVPVDYDPRSGIGTGPYKLESFVPGRQAVLTRNESYWREAAHIDRLVISTFTDDSSRLNALLGGQVDIVPLASYSQVPIAKASPALAVYDEPSARWEPVVMRCDVEPFKDVRVRQALRLLVDREQIVSQVYAGHARVGNDLFGAMDADYAGTLAQRHQDIDKAKFLLKAAGHADLGLEIVTAPLNTTVVASAEVFAQQAKAANVNVKVRRIDPASFFGADFLKRPFTQDVWGNFPLVPLMSLTVLPGAGNNETGWYDERTDKLIAQARAELDQSKRSEIVHDIQGILHAEGGYIVPALLNGITLYSTKVTGFPADMSRKNDFGHRYRNLWFTA